MRLNKPTNTPSSTVAYLIPIKRKIEQATQDTINISSSKAQDVLSQYASAHSQQYRVNNL